MKNLFSITSLILSLVLVSAIASAAPSASVSNTNSNSVITQLSIDQVKNGKIGVDKFLVGDWTAFSGTFAKFTSDGKLGVALNGGDNPSESLDVNGSIRLGALSVPNRSICADKDGNLTTCGFAEYYYGQSCRYTNGVYGCDSPTTTASYTTAEFKVPTGVSSITVEVFGSGASGWAYYNSNQSKDGGSTIFYDTNGTTALLTANGGNKPSSANSGGSGGTASVSNASKVSGSSTKTGGTGGDGDTAGGKSTYNLTCAGTSYATRVPGDGGNGGEGGKSGNGSPTPGGLGGHKGIPLRDLDTTEQCISYDNGRGQGYLGDDGVKGVFGSGGSGGGGRGGSADRDIDYLCTDYNYSYCNDSTRGFSGGGGGGYAKATISVSAGQIYKLRLAQGGYLDGVRTEVQTCWLNYHYSGTCTTGSLSGDGGDGYAKISW